MDMPHIMLSAMQQHLVLFNLRALEVFAIQQVARQVISRTSRRAA
jgi:hypothetical protein